MSRTSTTVTGREYKRTRPRGFTDWRPQARSRVLLEAVEATLDEYRLQQPLTLRQIFYALVGRHGYEKTEAAYERLGELVNRARRARIIGMHAIRDDNASYHPAGGWSSPAEFWRSVEATGRYYQRDVSIDQPRVVELWVEAAGMAPQIARIAKPYGVDVYASGGFDSLTAKYSAAVRIADETRPVAVVQIGDHDPSGCSVIDSAAEDIGAFVNDLGGTPPAFSRLAVTPAQIRRHQLPSAPQKRADRRGAHMTATVQVEAMPPEVLADEVEAAIRKLINLRTLQTSRRRSERERDEITRTLDRLAFVKARCLQQFRRTWIRIAVDMHPAVMQPTQPMRIMWTVAIRDFATHPTLWFDSRITGIAMGEHPRVVRPTQSPRPGRTITTRDPTRLRHIRCRGIGRSVHPPPFIVRRAQPARTARFVTAVYQARVDVPAAPLVIVPVAQSPSSHRPGAFIHGTLRHEGTPANRGG